MFGYVIIGIIVMAWTVYDHKRTFGEVLVGDALLSLFYGIMWAPITLWLLTDAVMNTRIGAKINVFLKKKLW